MGKAAQWIPANKDQKASQRKKVNQKRKRRQKANQRKKVKQGAKATQQGASLNDNKGRHREDAQVAAAVYHKAGQATGIFCAFFV